MEKWSPRRSDRMTDVKRGSWLGFLYGQQQALKCDWALVSMRDWSSRSLRVVRAVNMTFILRLACKSNCKSSRIELRQIFIIIERKNLRTEKDYSVIRCDFSINTEGLVSIGQTLLGQTTFCMVGTPIILLIHQKL